MLSLETKHCDGEKEVQIELRETGWQLFYTATFPEAVELGASGTCFQMKKNLCGPDSLSFFSKEGDLVLTACDGTLTMRKEYDHCG